MSSNSDNLIKVSKLSIPKAVAGKIAHSVRDGIYPTCLCVGAACVNQAVKAISIARTFLSKEGYEISFQTAFRELNNRPNLAMHIRVDKPKVVNYPYSDVDMSIGKTSKPQSVAGAMCAKIRENKRVSLTAIGMDAMANAVLAIGFARVYLEQNRLDVRAMPEFIVINKNDQEWNAIHFHIITEEFDEASRFPFLFTSSPALKTNYTHFLASQAAEAPMREAEA
mmetsp:Transcript_33598/g.60674  ORF Transcript_33598/g.60674 Transcript_33598/m.60674 type:complete len:224 (-) Transcript_33598:1085-1756(-)|eukprot:CAMPEP_0175061914 /NCGR_PEP_ID=MMETSP0052_2-20121109/13858_1 /TAXON_ID=51329 ORGANISM="Polytomella parva, Strain SAG 63-3" /NCGR_SAMPLE_ID=MMETSP0052_2 /ASSEMBLY_ACC=CAM_ASM_000194 /LENGTH=223 /DNA_ID=CAMNT_0016327839 /DNA_START=57 /DNA_END=728 /DNA_ORIENTATION=-